MSYDARTDWRALFSAVRRAIRENVASHRDAIAQAAVSDLWNSDAPVRSGFCLRHAQRAAALAVSYRPRDLQAHRLNVKNAMTGQCATGLKLRCGADDDLRYGRQRRRNRTAMIAVWRDHVRQPVPREFPTAVTAMCAVEPT